MDDYAKKMLQDTYNKHLQGETYPYDLLKFSADEQELKTAAIKHLKLKGLVNEHPYQAGTGYLELTKDGLELVENGFQESSPSVNNYNTVNVQNAHNSNIGAVQHDIQQTISITNGVSFDEIRKLIQEKPIYDQQQLNELVDFVEDTVSNNRVIASGILSGFSNILSKYQDIAVSICSSFLPWLLNKI